MAKSFSNLNPFKWYKPLRSFFRGALTLLGAILGAWKGVVLGAALGSVIIPIPIVGTVIGAVLGGFFGSLITASLVAAVSKLVTWAFGTISSREPKEEEIIENNATNPEKYVLSNESYKNFLRTYPRPQSTALPSAPWAKLQNEMKAVKAEKAKTGFWGSFYWTDEFDEKQKQNKILKAIKADPVNAVKLGRIKLNSVETYEYKDGKAADDPGKWQPVPRTYG